ncbi:Flp pilus assembly protein CpaB [Aeromicrobium sp. NPDC092404]|uniref:Flp pilus assembly protein CpaB n=1 Tax=Aeromicrobium sp. NPDC092404 TaxID=3154976 RepID=UPI003434587D
MNKRVIAAVAAGVLALLGVLVLFVWAQGANDRAYEGAKLVSVVRVTEDVSQGTSAAELADSTEVVELPAESVPDGAVTKLDQVSGLATNASLQDGEVLLKSRMVAPGERKGKTDVPKGFQEISIALDSEHSVAGAVKPGDRVGVIVTFEPKDSSAPQFTNFTLNQVLVTKADTAVVGEKGEITGTMLTLAVKTLDAEKIVHSQKWGTVWVTLQNSDTDTSGSKIITAEDVVK